MNQHAQTVVRFRYKFRNNNQRNGLALCASLWDDVSQQNCSRQSRRTEGACTRCVLANRGDVLDDGLNKHSLCCRCEKTHLLPPSASQCSSNSCIGFSGSFRISTGKLFSIQSCRLFSFHFLLYCYDFIFVPWSFVKTVHWNHFFVTDGTTETIRL